MLNRNRRPLFHGKGRTITGETDNNTQIEIGATAGGNNGSSVRYLRPRCTIEEYLDNTVQGSRVVNIINLSKSTPTYLDNLLLVQPMEIGFL